MKLWECEYWNWGMECGMVTCEYGNAEWDYGDVCRMGVSERGNVQECEMTEWNYLLLQGRKHSRYVRGATVSQ